MDINKLSQIKRQILINISLGLTTEEAFLLANLTEEEEMLLKNDDVFLKEIEIIKLEEEKRLLSLHRKASIKAAVKGNPSSIQWKLERIRPDKWGKSDKVLDTDKPLNINISFLDEEALLKDDSIEIN